MFDKNKDGRLDLNDLARYCSNGFIHRFLAPTSVFTPFCSNACSTFSWEGHRGGGDDEGHTKWQKLYKQHWGGQHILGGMAPAPLGGTPVTLLVTFFVLIDQPLCVLLCLSLFMMFFYFVFIFYCSALIYIFFCPCILIESLTKPFEGLKIFIRFHHISIWQKSVFFLQNFGLKRKFPAEV